VVKRERERKKTLFFVFSFIQVFSMSTRIFKKKGTQKHKKLYVQGTHM
jgi:hypothetical protein